MTAVILDGKTFAEQIRTEVAAEAAAFTKINGRSNPAWPRCSSAKIPPARSTSATSKKTSEKAGILSVLHQLKAETTSAELLALIDRLNRDPKTHGILVQTPLCPNR